MIPDGGWLTQEQAYEQWCRANHGTGSQSTSNNLEWLLRRVNRGQIARTTPPTGPARPRRVLMVLCQRPVDTGSGTVTRELVARLPKTGYEVGLLYGGYEGDDAARLLSHPPRFCERVTFGPGRNTDIPFPVVGMSDNMPYPSRPFKDLSPGDVALYCGAWRSKLAQCFRVFEPDIVHAHHLWLVAAIATLEAGQTPVVVSVHGTDLRRAHDCPHLAHLVRPHLTSMSRILLLANNASNDIRELYGADSASSLVLGNGFDEALFRPKAPDPAVLAHYHVPWDPGRKVALFVGKFDRPKGVEWLIRAFARIKHEGVAPDASLVIAGAGPDADIRWYKDLVRQNNITRAVSFPGQIEPIYLPDLFNAARVVVLPAFHEPFGLVLLEALACGTRVVTTDQGGPPEFIPESLRVSGSASLVSGLRSLHPAQDEERRFVEQLADSVAKQLSQPSTQEERSAISRSVQALSWSTYVKRLAQVYEGALDRRDTTQLPTP